MASRDPDRARAHRPLRRLAQQATTVRQRRESLHLFFRSSMKQAGDFFFFCTRQGKVIRPGDAPEPRRPLAAPWAGGSAWGGRVSGSAGGEREGPVGEVVAPCLPRGQGGLARESKSHTQKVIGRGAKPAPSRCPKKAMPKEEGGRGEAARVHTLQVA